MSASVSSKPAATLPCGTWDVHMASAFPHCMSNSFGELSRSATHLRLQCVLISLLRASSIHSCGKRLLIGVCSPNDLAQLVMLGDDPPPQGGALGKRGLWSINPDGSGTWTRVDRNQHLCRELFRSGPTRAEVHTRITLDDDIGETLDVTRDYANCRKRDAQLPEPCPRNIRTVFHFTRTAQHIPSSGVLPEACVAREFDLESMD